MAIKQLDVHAQKSTTTLSSTTTTTLRAFAQAPRGKGLLVAGSAAAAAAATVANDLRRPMLRVDLGTVVGKYIGETEKNLDRVFDDATKTNAVLFFDEADALFGKRSEVKDSHDRYANVEVDYLLQRIEGYAGLVILATNARANFDPSRFHSVVDADVG